MDSHPERLVRAVRDDVCGVLPTRPFDAGVRPTGTRPQEPRQLGYDRPVRHVVEALVDDPEALLDLLETDEVAGEAVAFGPGRDVELELRKDRVRMGPTNVERDAGGPQVRARHTHAQRGRAVYGSEAAHPADEDLVLVEEA